MCTVCDLMKASSHEWRGCYKEIEVEGYCQYSLVKLSILLVREILRLTGKIKNFQSSMTVEVCLEEGFEEVIKGRSLQITRIRLSKDTASLA